MSSLDDPPSPLLELAMAYTTGNYPTKKALNEAIENPEFVRGQEQTVATIAAWMAEVAESMKISAQPGAGAVEDLAWAILSGEWRS